MVGPSCHDGPARVQKRAARRVSHRETFRIARVTTRHPR